jgi:HSP20 family protein
MRIGQTPEPGPVRSGKEENMENMSLAPRPHEHAGAERDPFAVLRREMDALFDGFFSDFGESVPGLKSFNPRVDVTESDKEIRITAELPGVEEKDVEVSLTRDGITIKGEKRSEKEDKADEHYRLERSYGSFRRSFSLPCEVDSNKANATFKKGVLTVTLPKTEQAAKSKKIAVKTS